MDNKIYDDIKNPKLKKALMQVNREIVKEYPSYHYNHMNVNIKFWGLIREIKN